MNDIKQSKSCLWYIPLASNNIMACHYCFFNGSPRDKGTPCGSFEKRTAKRRNAIKKIQEESFHNPERRGKTAYERSLVL